MPHRHGKPFGILAKAPLVTEWLKKSFGSLRRRETKMVGRLFGYCACSVVFFYIVFLLHSLVCGLLLHISTSPYCSAEHARDCSAPPSRIRLQLHRSIFRDRWNAPKQAAAAADQPPLAGPSGLQPAVESPSAARETSSASLLERFRAEASPAPAESVLPRPLSALPVLELSAEGVVDVASSESTSTVSISTSCLMRRHRLSCPPWRVVRSVQASKVLVRLWQAVGAAPAPKFS